MGASANHAIWGIHEVRGGPLNVDLVERGTTFLEEFFIFLSYDG